MKILLDEALCDAYAECIFAAPDLFAMDDDDDVVRLLVQVVPDDQRAKAEEAVRVCPARALRVED